MFYKIICTIAKSDNHSTDPDLVHERLTKIEEARQRMQEKYNKDLEIAKQKEQEVIFHWYFIPIYL